MRNYYGKHSLECEMALNYIISKMEDYNLNREFPNQVPVIAPRIQIILYFSQIIYMKLMGKPMLKDDFYAWPNNPAIPEVYTRCMFSSLGKGDRITQSNVGYPSISEEMCTVIDYVLKDTNDMDISDLREKSRMICGLWQEVYNPDYDDEYGQVISKDMMLKHCQLDEEINDKVKKLTYKNR